MKKVFFILVTVLLVYSCKKDTIAADPIPEPTPAPTSGTLKVSFKGVVDASPLVYGNSYKNAYGDTFTVSKFKYYISNVELTMNDGTKHKEAESYHLIDHLNLSTRSFVISNIAPGTYKSITYIIGVDSARNTSGAQDFDLSPSKDMYWGWVTGYIMLKLEGTSPQSGSFDKSLTFHLGGFSSPYGVLKKCSITFAQDISISNSKSPELILKTNVNELFKSPTIYGFSSTYNITGPGLNAYGFSANYVDMITFDSIVQ